jgi:diacylglycerol kinase family enzyme
METGEVVSTTLKKAHLIANTKSGKGVGAEIPAMTQKLCDELGIHLMIYSTSQGNEQFEAEIKRAVASAVEDGGVVIAAGGDGTIRSVAQEAVHKNVRFAAVAVGTFNFFARTHNLPEEPEAALRLALTGKAVPVRLAEINGIVFLINATIGLYAKSITEREQRTKIWGRNRVVATLSTVYSLFNKHKLLRADFAAKNKELKFITPMIFIGNNELQLENLSFKCAECFKDDNLALILMKPLSRATMLRVLVNSFTGHINQDKDVVSYCVRNLLISTSRKSHNVAVDGEIFHLTTPLDVKVLPEALLLVKSESEE